MASYSTKMRVFQNWGTTAPGTATDQNVFVFGPRYDLHRYEEDDEREQLEPFQYERDVTSVSANVVFSDTDTRSVFPVGEGYELDKASVAVYAEDAYVKVANATVSEIVGDPLDGVLKLSSVAGCAAGLYIGFQSVSSSVVSTVFAKIASVNATSSTVTLVEGLPDDVYDTTEPQEETDPVEYTIKSGITVFVAESRGLYKLAASEFTATDTSLTVSSSELVKASVYAGYRAKFVGKSRGIDVLASISDVEEVLGKADPDNPLAMGVFNAFVGGAPVVYYYETPGDTAADMSGALDAAQMQKSLYFIVPMTQDSAALEAVVAEVKRLSREDTKRWRIVFLCSKVDRTATIDVTLVSAGKYTVSGVDRQIFKIRQTSAELYSGDVLTWSGAPKSFTVDKKLNATTILVTGAYDNTVTVTEGTAATIEHEYTPMEYARAVAGAAKRHGSLRVVDCFPKTYGFQGSTYSSMYLAPIFAGMAASVIPQAPITNATVPGVDDLPDTYAGLNETQLDTIAAGGVMIAMQDLRNDGVYIRKQLTTSQEGSIVTTELSCVKNFDNVTHRFSNLLDTFKGSYNVTPTLVESVELAFTTLLHELMFNGQGDFLGPQLLAGSEVTDVYVDPTNATRIIAHVHCVVPAPFNEMDLYLSCDVTAEVTAAATTETAV